MDFSLDKEQKLLREKIIKFAQRKLNIDVSERDKKEIFPRELWLQCGEMGLQGLPVPQEYGGIGLDPLSTAIALEALGYGCRDGGLVFAICAHLLACVIPIWKFGTEQQKQIYLPGLCNGTVIAANAITEPGSGSDAFSMSTKAQLEGDLFRLNGGKIFISNCLVADIALVFAVTDPEKRYHGGITAFLVEKKASGFETGQKFEKMGLRTCMLGEIKFEDVILPKNAVLGGIGAGASIFAYAMDWERICIAASHIGAMEYLLEKAIKYAQTRIQYGSPIGKFQAISHKIADIKVRLETARLLTYRAASLLDRSREVSIFASMTKLFVSESLLKTAMDTAQIFGGYGYMTEYEVERILRDSVGSTIYSGTSEIQRNIISRWLGL
jgi:alkylation response protein AidB-like acyl-CoA dehydrogenase